MWWSNIIPMMAIMTFVTLMAFVSQRKQILMSLLCLEAVTLTLALLITIVLSPTNFSNLFVCLVILTMGACEASIALALLVLITRSYGTDMITSLSINKC